MGPHITVRTFNVHFCDALRRFIFCVFLISSSHLVVVSSTHMSSSSLSLESHRRDETISPSTCSPHLVVIDHRHHSRHSILEIELLLYFYQNRETTCRPAICQLYPACARLCWHSTNFYAKLFHVALMRYLACVLRTEDTIKHVETATLPFWFAKSKFLHHSFLKKRQEGPDDDGACSIGTWCTIPVWELYMLLLFVQQRGQSEVMGGTVVWKFGMVSGHLACSVIEYLATACPTRCPECIKLSLYVGSQDFTLLPCFSKRCAGSTSSSDTVVLVWR